MPDPLNLSHFDDRSYAAAAAEADHRIGNSLAIIAGLVRVKATEVSRARDPKAFLLEIAERIETVARLHRHVAHSSSDSVRLDQYFGEIFEILNHALARVRSSYSLDCPPGIAAPFNTALPLGLVVAELVTNSLKYAHPAGLPVKLRLSCRQSAPDRLRMIYEDDGVGFPEGFDAAQDGHLGMRFIRSLSEQLGATPRWHSDSLGVQFELTIPLRRAALSRSA